MKAIAFTGSDEEKDRGARIIVLNGLVDYTTGREGVYRVPNYVIALLKKHRIPYKLVNLKEAPG